MSVDVSVCKGHMCPAESTQRKRCRNRSQTIPYDASWATSQGLAACGGLQREDVYVHRPRHSSHSLCPSHVITAVLVVEEDCKLNPSAAAAWRMSSGTGKALYAGRSAWH